jgi:hypothetical protein
MFSRIFANNGSSIFDKFWPSSNFQGVYDDWLNFTSAYFLARTLDVSSEVVAIGYTDTLGNLIFIKMTITDDNNPAIIPAA